MEPTVLDKQFSPELETHLGKMSIRVVVFAKRTDKNNFLDEDLPKDMQEDEDFGSGDSPVNGYLESPKGGKMCCVFLINGQRQHFIDNSIIVNELKMKYLRKRMLIVVDLDALSQRAIAEIMQGSRSGFYEGHVFGRIKERLVATLQDDPDLTALESEAEDELSQLQAGDAVVQNALDELIDQHFELGDHTTTGGQAKGGTQGQFYGPDGKPVDVNVVVYGDDGLPVVGPALVSNHAASTLRLSPNSCTSITISASQEADWLRLNKIDAFVEPKVEGINIKLTKNETSAELEIEHNEQAEPEVDEYPLETTLRVMASFNDEQEPRLIEKNLVVRPKNPRPPQPPRALHDTPTYLKVRSRQPIRIIAGGPDTHVRLSWDGKDYLTLEPSSVWSFTATCMSHPAYPAITFTKPADGRFEALLHTPEDYIVGTKLEFEIKASGPGGASLLAKISAEVSLPPGPRKIVSEIPVQGQRRPPYKLVYITEKDFGNANRWGTDIWDAGHAAAFIEPTKTSPLILCINQDFGILRSYMDGLVDKKAAEQRVEEKKTKYSSHIAYHLYQMYLGKEEIRKQKSVDTENTDLREPHEQEMQDEINRVASTLIRLMEVMR